MNNINQNKTAEELQPIFNKMVLRFVKADLDSIMSQLDDVWEKLKEDKELRLSTEIAHNKVEDLYEEVDAIEEKISLQ
jgi:galactokinase/mevalonate kinase-like predicted kinase